MYRLGVNDCTDYSIGNSNGRLIVWLIDQTISPNCAEKCTLHSHAIRAAVHSINAALLMCTKDEGGVV